MFWKKVISMETSLFALLFLASIASSRQDECVDNEVPLSSAHSTEKVTFEEEFTHTESGSVKEINSSPTTEAISTFDSMQSEDNLLEQESSSENIHNKQSIITDLLNQNHSMMEKTFNSTPESIFSSSEVSEVSNTAKAELKDKITPIETSTSFMATEISNASELRYNYDSLESDFSDATTDAGIEDIQNTELTNDVFTTKSYASFDVTDINIKSETSEQEEPPVSAFDITEYPTDTVELTTNAYQLTNSIMHLGKKDMGTGLSTGTKNSEIKNTPPTKSAYHIAESSTYIVELTTDNVEITTDTYSTMNPMIYLGKKDMETGLSNEIENSKTKQNDSTILAYNITEAATDTVELITSTVEITTDTVELTTDTVELRANTYSSMNPMTYLGKKYNETKLPTETEKFENEQISSTFESTKIEDSFNADLSNSITTKDTSTDEWILKDVEIVTEASDLRGGPVTEGETFSYATTLTAGIEEDLRHKCVRDCSKSTHTKVCKYEFQLEWYLTMSKACYDCPHNVTDCLRPDCVPADGLVRPLYAVNRRMPGPSIHVCEGDELVVDVRNGLLSDSTSVHWHGLHMKGNQFMDGVPFLTQCPIPAGTSFRYHFVADQPGTHYWHSHSGLQRMDGMYGLLVVRPRSDPHSLLYDVDDPKHMMVLSDWSNALSVDMFTRHHHLERDVEPHDILVNGMGIFAPLESNETLSFTPMYEFRVKKGLRYRIRSLSNGNMNCPIQISIEKHTMLVIASDGQDIQPLQVESLVIYGGERWDVVVRADQPEGAYWVNFRGTIDCGEASKSAHQIAVLRYEQDDTFPDHPTRTSYNSTKRDGFELNSLNSAPSDHQTFFTAATMKSNKEGDGSQYAGTPDQTFWLQYDFNDVDNELFQKKGLYPFYGVKPDRRVYLPQINHISMKLPEVPPLSQPEDLDGSSICNETTVSDCEQDFCYCSYVLNVDLGSLVEIVFVDSGQIYYANHPMHLHGYVFAVVGMERLGENTTLQIVKNLDAEGKLRRNFDNPPLKDTVTVPDGGYTVVRFIADNPGYWFMHCHLAFHVEIGMGLVFHVEGDLPPVPKDFPRCGSWMPEPVKNLQAQIDKLNHPNSSHSELLSEHNEEEKLAQTKKETSEPERYQAQGKSHMEHLSFPLILFNILICLFGFNVENF